MEVDVLDLRPRVHETTFLLKLRTKALRSVRCDSLTGSPRRINVLLIREESHDTKTRFPFPRKCGSQKRRDPVRFRFVYLWPAIDPRLQIADR